MAPPSEKDSAADVPRSINDTAIDLDSDGSETDAPSQYVTEALGRGRTTQEIQPAPSAETQLQVPESSTPGDPAAMKPAVKMQEKQLESPAETTSPSPPAQARRRALWSKVSAVVIRYVHFVGPGFLVAVAYIDPGNYATDIQAGASTRYAHLFVVMMANLIAIFLQSLCIKLGSVTGLNLAENCRKHLPRWLNLSLYVLSEAAIIATDVAEVRPPSLSVFVLLTMLTPF